MVVHPKVEEAFVEHWKQLGYSKKDIYGDIDKWGRADPNSLLAAIQIFDGAHNRGGSDRNHKIFSAKTATSKKPITERVSKVYRILEPKTKKDYLMYSGSYVGIDFAGNEIEQSFTHKGTYELPMFRRKVSVDKDGIMNVEETNTIDRTEKVYELEWNKENLAKLAEGYYSQLDFSTMFYLIDGQRKFKVSQDDFENMSRAGIIAKYHDAYHKKDTSDATKQLTDTIKEAITGSRQEPTPRKKRQKAQAN